MTTGRTGAYFAYPAEPATQPVKVYGTDQGVFENGKYDAVAKHLLTASAQAAVGSPQLTAAASGDVKTESQTFKDGQPSGGLRLRRAAADVPAGCAVDSGATALRRTAESTSRPRQAKETSVRVHPGRAFGR
ncbi:hypothetical protein AB4089_19030 [Arthrobacter sp. 2MCAF15]|uniref:hypothetical protein n=1 Tax=Arthrobacter sp. 2MCAF15 TaxID=3232984 RepID=UPI003F8F665D